MEFDLKDIFVILEIRSLVKTDQPRVKAIAQISMSGTETAMPSTCQLLLSFAAVS